MNEDKKLFLNYLTKQNYPPDFFNYFEDYVTIITEWNKKINLVSKKSLAKIWTRHFLDSILIGNYFNFENKKIIDLGSGAGFPGIPLKIIYPTLQLTLIESRRKKSLFLKYLIEKLDLGGCKVLRKRFENTNEIANHSCDYILARAIKLQKMYIENAFRLLQDNGKFIIFISTNQANDIVSNLSVNSALSKNLISGQEPDYGEYKFLILGRK